MSRGARTQSYRGGGGQRRKSKGNKENRRKRSKGEKSHQDWTNGAESTGHVVGRLGPVFTVELDDFSRISCIARGAGKRAVIGDEVAFNWEESELAQGLILNVKSRRNSLVRADALGRKAQTLVANLDRVWIVSALWPELKPGLIDRYLVAAAQGGINAGLVINKIDLILDQQHQDDLEFILEPYRLLGLPIYLLSAETGVGVDAFRSALANERSVLVGHSGVGKTSLLNALVPEIDEEVQVVSEATGKGQHTTTTSTLYQLDDGAALIDSPGIRAFALWGLEPTQLKDYFPEIKALLGQCHFHNCLHIEEPRCAVRQAVENEALPPERYEAYLNLFYDLKEELGR